MNMVGLKSDSLGRKPWKKLLYVKQPYPDNYTDFSFLSQLRRNETVTKISYVKLISDFSLILFHINNLVLVLLLFAGIYNDNWDPITLAGTSLTVSLILYTIWELKLNEVHTDFSSIKLFIIIIFVISIISPVLRSLTRSTASDSIWSISFMLNVSNIIFHDYSMNTDITYYKPIISTNLSITNSLFLASRLSSSYQVFCFISLSIQINVLLPLFDFSIRKRHKYIYHNLLFIGLVILVYGLLLILTSKKILFIWLCVQSFILFILPAYFSFLQRYKNELSGPWDIARPVIKSKSS